MTRESPVRSCQGSHAGKGCCGLDIRLASHAQFNLLWQEVPLPLEFTSVFPPYSLVEYSKSISNVRNKKTSST